MCQLWKQLFEVDSNFGRTPHRKLALSEFVDPFLEKQCVYDWMVSFFSFPVDWIDSLLIGFSADVYLYVCVSSQFCFSIHLVHSRAVRMASLLSRCDQRSEL